MTRIGKVAAAAALCGTAIATLAGAETPLPESAYARAEALDKPSVRELVWNELVVPHWLGGGDEFWYRK